MKNVYCKNCKWYKYKNWKINGRMIGTEVWYDCKCIHICLYNNPNGRVGISDMYLLEECESTNKYNQNNNCPHYKRKWYKFWVK